MCPSVHPSVHPSVRPSTRITRPVGLAVMCEHCARRETVTNGPQRKKLKNESDQKKVHQKIELTFNFNKEISLKIDLNKKISILKFTSKIPSTTVKLETRLAKGCEFTRETIYKIFLTTNPFIFFYQNKGNPLKNTAQPSMSDLHEKKSL